MANEWVRVADAETGVERWVTEEYLERWPDDYKRLGKPHLRDENPPTTVDGYADRDASDQSYNNR